VLDPGSDLPLYAQVKEVLVRQIRSGQYQPQEPLPAERLLMEQFGVSRITVRRALSDLEAAGVVSRKVGRGTYVAAEPIVETLTDLTGHLEELQVRHMNPEVTLVLQEFRTPMPEVAAALDGAERVLYARRLVWVGGAPLLLLDLCLPEELGAAIDPRMLTDVPVHRLLDLHGFVASAGEQRMAARGAQADEATLLDIPQGAPALEVIRTEWTGAGKGLLWSRALYRSDRYQYVIRLHRRRGMG
jgi:GntR family transcriptional regulator